MTTKHYCPVKKRKRSQRGQEETDGEGSDDDAEKKKYFGRSGGWEEGKRRAHTYKPASLTVRSAISSDRCLILAQRLLPLTAFNHSEAVIGCPRPARRRSRRGSNQPSRSCDHQPGFMPAVPAFHVP